MGSGVSKINGNVQQKSPVMRLSQNQLAATLTNIRLGGLTDSEAETNMAYAFNMAQVGTSVTIDNRAIGGMRGSASGVSYEFRKNSNGTWDEIFGDHAPVTNTQLARMKVESRGYQKGRR